MSKRAIEKAYVAYPLDATNQYDIRLNANRVGYQQGYEQGEKDAIRTVKTWLSEIHRVCDITDENGYRIELRNLIASLEKTLEED